MLATGQIDLSRARTRSGKLAFPGASLAVQCTRANTSLNFYFNSTFPDQFIPWPVGLSLPFSHARSELALQSTPSVSLTSPTPGPQELIQHVISSTSLSPPLLCSPDLSSPFRH